MQSGLPCAAATQLLPQLPSGAGRQHVGSIRQTKLAQGLHMRSSGAPVWHSLCAHEPAGWQSLGQLALSSPVSHAPLPQFGQQSCWQVPHVSPMSHAALPQHEPQSEGHEPHVSVGPHVPSPQPMPPELVVALVEPVVVLVEEPVVAPVVAVVEPVVALVVEAAPP